MQQGQRLEQCYDAANRAGFAAIRQRMRRDPRYRQFSFAWDRHDNMGDDELADLARECSRP